MAALAKFNNLSAFSDVLRKQGILSHRLIPLVSVGVPTGEGFTAVLLLVGFLPLVSAGFCLFLCSGFLIGKALAARQNPSAACGCYGASTARVGDAETIIVSLLLLIVALLAVGLAASNAGGNSYRLLVIGPVDVGLVLLAGVVIVRRLRVAVRSFSNDQAELFSEAGHL